MRERPVALVSEQTDLIRHAGLSHPADAESTSDDVRKDHLVKVLTARVHDQTDSLAAKRVEKTASDEPSIHCGIEPREVNGVVHVPVDVDVLPLSIHLAKPVEIASRARPGPCHERLLSGNYAGTAVPYGTSRLPKRRTRMLACSPCAIMPSIAHSREQYEPISALASSVSTF